MKNAFFERAVQASYAAMTAGRFAIAALFALPPLCTTGVALADESLGTIEIHAHLESHRHIEMTRPRLAPPAIDVAKLPEDAREAYTQMNFFESRLSRGLAAVHAAGEHTEGPALMDYRARGGQARLRLRLALEAEKSTLGADAWLLLGLLELQTGPSRNAEARAAFTQATARGGHTDAGLHARLLEAEMAIDAGDRENARTGLETLVAHAPAGTLRAYALAALGDAARGTEDAARHYARALPEADPALRSYLLFSSVNAEIESHPREALRMATELLASDDEAIAARIAPVLGDLLYDAADPAGDSLPATLPPERAARALLAAGDVAAQKGPRVWTEHAYQAAEARVAPASPLAAEAKQKLDAVTRSNAPILDLRGWMTWVGERCGSRVFAAQTGTRAALDVIVRRVRTGPPRIVARGRDRTPLEEAFEQCIEEPLPDMPTLPAAATYIMTMRLYPPAATDPAAHTTEHEHR